MGGQLNGAIKNTACRSESPVLDSGFYKATQLCNLRKMLDLSELQDFQMRMIEAFSSQLLPGSE